MADACSAVVPPLPAIRAGVPFSRSCIRAPSPTSTSAKRTRCNGTFCTLAKPLRFDQSGFFSVVLWVTFRLSIVCKYSSLKRKCSYTYQLYTYIFTFYCTFMGTYFTYCGGRRTKKTVKENVQKKPESHPVACFCYTWKHVVQLSTSTRTIPSLFHVYTITKCVSSIFILIFVF